MLNYSWTKKKSQITTTLLQLQHIPFNPEQVEVDYMNLWTKFYYFDINECTTNNNDTQGSLGNLEKSGRLRSLYAFLPSLPSSVP